MKITTKEVFQWNKETEKYDSIECESYEYSGEVDECKKWDWNWWFGPNSLYGKLRPDEVSFAGATAAWEDPVTGGKTTLELPGSIPTIPEDEILKYGIIAVAAYMLLKK
jgi:hypothetical protein